VDGLIHDGGSSFFGDQGQYAAFGGRHKSARHHGATLAGIGSTRTAPRTALITEQAKSRIMNPTPYLLTTFSTSVTRPTYR
jgi:hypothetical protein